MSAFAVQGFALVTSVFEPVEIAQMRQEADRLSVAAGAPCVRHLGKRSPIFRDVAAGTRITELIGQGLRPVRSILFDKTPSENWAVSWHQDITIAVTQKIEVPGYGPWSVKDGVVHAQAPVKLLEKMVAVRIHLDDTPPENGALRIIPGSHLYGRLEDDALNKMVENNAAAICSACAGDVLLMKPLLLHASLRSAVSGRRRVLHFEYAPPDALNPRLNWAEAVVGPSVEKAWFA